MRKEWGLAAIACLLLSGCGGSGPFGDMEPGERGRVVRIIDGDALVLDTGQSVRLVGVEAPAMNWRDDDPEPHAEASSRMLEDLVMGREVRLYYPGLTRDRYDRALAHVATADAKGPAYWLNMEMLRRGGARLRVYPDTSAGSEALLEAELAAREASIGLWKEAEYLPLRASAVTPETRGFLIIFAELAGPASQPEETYGDPPACSRQTQGGALIIDIETSAEILCDTEAGVKAELRGWVSGGRLELVHPLHFVRLPDGG
ncbi:thermonuclease family protein [Henriciella marina]|uniref:thermonuclease family protein n=1 Tax=Henriciella marina TaxID=453851 RepID=UPI000367610B|nr:thermonuclease family protein [Henriciella marina]